MANNQNDHSPRHASGRAPNARDNTLSEESFPASPLVDWRHIPFLMVDSPQTKFLEDAVASRGAMKDKTWSADLKVIHPLPLDGLVSLKEREDQVCFGIRDVVAEPGSRSPFISLALARNLTRVTDRQAHALLGGKERSVTGLGGEETPDPTLIDRVTSHLRAVRATALQISDWKDRPLNPEHAMAILSTHAQSTTIQATRGMRSCPTLIVLRHQGARPITDKEWKAKGVPYATKRGVSVVAVGKAVPTILGEGEVADPFDSLRLKERAHSGAINITQIACSLLGISPIPEALVRQGLRSDSEYDSCKRGGPLSDSLVATIRERRGAIREVLRTLTDVPLG